MATFSRRGRRNGVRGLTDSTKSHRALARSRFFVLKARRALQLNIGSRRDAPSVSRKPEAMSFARIAASAAILICLGAACASAKPIAALGETNLRRAPGTDSPVLTIIPKGATVEVGKCSKGWCEANFESRDGFVMARNVGLGQPRKARAGGQVYDEQVIEGVGPPRFAPPLYYGYHGPYYGLGPFYGYYAGWGYRGWRW